MDSQCHFLTSSDFENKIQIILATNNGDGMNNSAELYGINYLDNKYHGLN